MNKQAFSLIRKHRLDWKPAYIYDIMFIIGRMDFI